ncbi:Gfo/Idh/MocA family protein [Microbacterium gorillae]|uniref:Gfo/Idh/MocA family protein n=1 Tax=Microbacterium gorillae TaxID=1231063 RepID=UPI000B9B8DCB|nr:Gfo/Idh/MocA family oxidoreductase [Microbacterium gorillae]
MWPPARGGWRPPLRRAGLGAGAALAPERAAAVAAEAGVRADPIEDLLAAEDIDLVINLTVPAVHAEVSLQVLAAGKQVYSEKPLAADVASGARVMAASDTTGRWVGCAPDTVLGVGLQTARKVIDDGVIGRPLAATATMVTPGHERWHPNPDFYYQAGGGPLLDMGPYYVTALVHLLGPVVSVTASASRMRDERVIGSGDRAGQVIPVDVMTHVTGVLTHAGGALSTLIMSFDAVATRSANIEVHGETGSMVVPDPNDFDGDVLVRALGDAEWTLQEPSAGYRDAGRGVGVHDRAIAGDGARASGELGLHVLEIMESVLRAADEGCTVEVTSTCERPAPVPLQGL